MPNKLIHRDRRAILIWLSACLLLVAAMVMVGGYTRLSGSGLSITEWKPVHGVIPPLNESEWGEEFEAYRLSPQYEKINRGMSLDEFKSIYWPEYFHRLLGRAVGFLVLLPLIIFAARRSISKRLAWRLVGIFALGGLQGVVGWYMVKSGLVNDPHVSHLRLALHLSLAFAIFGLLEWTLLGILFPPPFRVGVTSSVTPSSILPLKGGGSYILWFTLLCLQIILGAFVAGLKAGLVYNTFPMMNGLWLPPEALTPPWHENHTLVQFIHRWLAVVVALGFLWWWYANRARAPFGACLFVAVALALQFTLGVATLLYGVPLTLALAHQMMALALFGAAIIILWHAKRGHRISEGDPAQSLRASRD